METPINPDSIGVNQAVPTILYIDLDSCFATLTQQIYPRLRDKPLVIAAYCQENSCILSPSKEAKKYGIKTGMRVRDARFLCPQLIIETADVALIRDAHDRFIKICNQYSPQVFPYSIDEVSLDMSYRENLCEETLISIAQKIKNDIRCKIGTWVTGSVGIGTNRFLSKVASSFKKPDGLYILTHKNLTQTYAALKLVELPGISTANTIRLNTYNIFTPLQFLQAPYRLLRHNVFKSITGYWWHMRLRGWEVDERLYGRKSFSHEYTCKKSLLTFCEIAPFLMYLCEKVMRRLRRHGYTARGVSVGLFFTDYTTWHLSKTFPQPFTTPREFFAHVVEIALQRPEKKAVRKLSVGSFHLTPRNTKQMDLFDDEKNKRQNVMNTIDLINDKYGEYTVSSALSLTAKHLITDRIAFGKR